VDTNIFVTKGLLSPYVLKIVSTNSGQGAIDKVKSGSVNDIIFMDHMMPAMDGVETTGILRKMGYERPIVALTANAVIGQYGNFLEDGFDDFISKPIDLRQLNKVLNKHIRDKQPPEVIEEMKKRSVCAEADVSELSIINPKYANAFARDVKKSLAVLYAFIERGDSNDEDDIREYTIHTHGMKGALVSIGNTYLAAIAQKLEQMGRDNKINMILNETPDFLKALQEYTDSVQPGQQHTSEDPTDEDKSLLEEKLLLIKSACDDFDSNAVDEALATLKEKPWPSQTTDLLEMISEKLLHSEFDEIVELIERFRVGDVLS